MPDRRVAGELGHDDDHVAHGAAWCGPRNWSTGPRPAAGLAARVASALFQVSGKAAERRYRRRIRSAGVGNYIVARIKRAEDRTIRACMAAVGEVIGKNVVELEKCCAALEAELAEMRDRETTRRLRAVGSSTPGAMIA
jgi:hypothetical protein